MRHVTQPIAGPCFLLIVVAVSVSDFIYLDVIYISTEFGAFFQNYDLDLEISQDLDSLVRSGKISL